jgi:ribosomal protein S18 acetylase RimI-like enzyme
MSALSFTYAELAISDYADTISMWKSTPGLGLSSADEPSEIKRFLDRNPGCSFICRDGAGRMVGTILAGHDGRRGFLYHLAVREDCRRRGIASELVRRAENALAQAGIQKTHIFVFKNNQLARSFWEKEHTLRDDLVDYARSL